jgi:hypothetical protein
MGAYTPFNVDGQRGGKYTHWFLSARMLPALLLAEAVPGGLTQHVFHGPQEERPSAMARRLRNDPKFGLGYCLGDKAADLFAKWAIGTLRLSPPSSTWTAADTVIPMDQRIGRLMMRTGFMDELFDVRRLLLRSMFDYRGEGPKPTSISEPFPSPYFLTVMDFRRSARIRSDTGAANWFARFWMRHRTGRSPLLAPQEVLSVMCQALGDALGIDFTPVDVDDAFMEIGEKWCLDQSPKCDACPLGQVCQANTDPSREALKSYFT